jgi:MoxR-like ATPase
LEPLPGNPPIIKELGILEVIAGGIVEGELIHIHGETGTGKNAIIEAIAYVPENWEALCGYLGVKHLPLQVFPIEMAVFETISEIYSRRALSHGQTYDEPSAIVQAIRKASEMIGQVYPLIWLREIGRAPTASVQGGLLNLMTKGLVRLNNDEMVSGMGIAWIADSNYHTDDSSSHVLVTQDDALNRRWTVNVAFDYLTPEQETEILKFHKMQGYIPPINEELILQVVNLGREIRERRRQGSLLSLAPPSIYGFAAFLRASHRHGRLSPLEIAENTLLGAASMTDRESARVLFADAFAQKTNETEAAAAVGRS